MIRPLFFIAAMLTSFGAISQPLHKKPTFTHADTLRGSIGPGRLGWDVQHYDITVKPDFNNKTIAGKNVITYIDSGVTTMQIDLQEPMIIDSIVGEGKTYSFNREGNVYWVKINSTVQKNNPVRSVITIYFQGKPREAINPPWDGGWIWRKDKNNNPWMSVACQGLGASVWYPCKDTQADESIGAILRIIVPDSLVGVGNGRLTSESASTGGYKTYTWQVTNPINNYCIVPSIGKYVNFSETFNGKKGPLDMSYWVLDYNLDSAKKQFADAPRMMKAFEYWFGPYPFYEDSYKLIESPHLGMEHQSGIAYGNKFRNGYRGADRSGSGWGNKWDFIIIHESGHEWFANNITTNDIADMWVHESFTNYSETLFTEYYYGKEAASDYLVGIRRNIRNDIPIIGNYGVNSEGSGDMYDKGGNLIHLIRQVIGSDQKFHNILLGLNKDFYHQTVTSAQIEQYISKKSGHDFSKIFDQYLRTTNIPRLQYKIEGNSFSYRWDSTVAGFNLPVKVSFGKKEKKITPTANWQMMKINGDALQFRVNRNYYIKTEEVTSL